MKKNFLKNAGIACVSLLLLFAAFSGCSSSSTPTAVADQTKLTALVDSCNTLLTGATTTNYPQAAITAFQSTLTSVQTAAASKTITQAAVNNLVIQLRAAEVTFLATNFSAVSPANLLFALTFDEGAGTQLTTTGSRAWTAVLTAGPSQVFGAATGLPTFVTGHKGMAMHFGAGSHLEISNYTSADLLKGQMSIAVWLKTDSTRAGNYIMSYNYWNTWKFQLQDGDLPFFTTHVAPDLYTDADDAGTKVTKGTWTHVVVSLNLTAGTLTFYVNGVNVKQWTTVDRPNLKSTLTPYATVLPLLIGSQTTYADAVATQQPTTISGWNYFVGAMDELKVYSIALNDGQVGLLYNNEK
jgi:hypothetical protein